MDIANLRQEYTKSGMKRSDMDDCPISLLQSWMQAAVEAGVTEPTAMALSTVGPDSRPSTRIVLLKGLDERGLLFFTNYQSRKGKDLEMNPQASVNLYWKELERQVSVEGSVSRCDREESGMYFQNRPRASQLGAWVSRQSEPVENRAALEDAFRTFEKQQDGQTVPLPPFWGGYILKPICMEFWQGRPSRLHDRFKYTRSENGSWELTRLCP